MKKILFIHTNYREQGGEDIAVENEIQFFKKFYDVEVIKFSNGKTNISDFVSFLSSSNKKSNKILKDKLQNFKPDVVYIHNTWFKASLGIFKVLKNFDTFVILKLHNFRYYCTKSFFSTSHLNGKESCNACGLDSKSLGFFNKYFKDSFIKSLFINIYGKRYFSLLKNFSMKILVLTDFHRSYLNNLGINKEKIAVFPNHIEVKKIKNFEKDNSIIYAGRVSKEKGVDELINSFLNIPDNNSVLKIIGNGPDLNLLKKKYKNKKIKFLGEQSNQRVMEEIKKSKGVVTATKLFEGQPTFLCEASSLSTPSVFPLSGGIIEFFPESYIYSFEQFDYQDLEEKLKMLINDDSLLTQGEENRRHLEFLLNEEKLINNFNELINGK